MSKQDKQHDEAQMTDDQIQHRLGHKWLLRAYDTYAELASENKSAWRQLVARIEQQTGHENTRELERVYSYWPLESPETACGGPTKTDVTGEPADSPDVSSALTRFGHQAPMHCGPYFVMAQHAPWRGIEGDDDEQAP